MKRKADKNLSRYQDNEEPDIFLLSKAEDLVPMLASEENFDKLHTR
ncbi:MAG: hypothetical protein KAF91_31855 [Nostoc sp. TH1S01]|nr:hypothetical protein [Nostoc sp. TH1S01]